MVALTATQLKTILDIPADYPHPNTRPLRFFTTVPKYAIYPYVVIRKQPPQSTEETITDTTKRDGFEITLYVRYTREQDLEEQEQTSIENTIISKLEATDFGTNALYFESKQWQRTPIPRLYGSQSRIILSVRDKVSTSGSGILGSQMTLQIVGGSTIQLLALNSTEGVSIERHSDDSGVLSNTVQTIDLGDYFFEYESTIALSGELETLRDTGNEVNVILTKGADTRDMNIIFGQTSKRGQFDNIERATTRFTVESVV